MFDLHLHSATRDRISLVVTKREVVSVRQIQSAQVSVAAEAKITNLDRMRPNIANQRRPNQKSVAINSTLRRSSL